MAKNVKQIQKLLSVLERQFVLSSDSNRKRGGLLAIAAVSIGLGKDTEHHLKELVNPILNCLKDVDSKVRYAAIESLYNVVKVSRTATIPIFPEVFTALSLLVTDQDAAVRNGSELLDRQLKVWLYRTTVFEDILFNYSSLPGYYVRVFTALRFRRLCAPAQGENLPKGLGREAVYYIVDFGEKRHPSLFGFT